jgi:peptide/nickel transport system ATP-binding protein
MSLLEVADLHTHFRMPGATLRAVDGVSFTVEAGEAVGLVGESGCGKTTAALSITRLLPPNGFIAGGTIIFNGEELTAMSEPRIRRRRWRDISLIFQGAMNALNPVMRVGAQVVEPILVHEKVTQRQAEMRVAELFELVGIPPRRMRDYPHEFSGGMRQRVMIAMALADRPKLIIGDEPTTALDVMVQGQILDLLERLRRDLGLALLLISHDLSVIAETCDRAVVMYAGRVAETGTIDQLYGRPCHPYTVKLLGSVPDLAGPRTVGVGIPGAPPDLVRPPGGCRFHPRCDHAMRVCSEEQPLGRSFGERHRVYCHAVTDAGMLPPPEALPLTASAHRIVAAEESSMEVTS